MEQTNEAIVQKNTGGKRVKKGGKAPLVIIGVIAGVLVLAYVALCAYAGSLDTFAPNRHINGIDVGGLTASEAQSKLETALLNQEIVVTDDTLQTQLTITVADLGYTAEDFAGDAQFWMDTDKGEPFLRKGWAYLAYVTGRWPGGANWPDMDQETLSATAAYLSEFFSQAPIDGSYEIQDDGVAITKAKDGRSVSKLMFETALADITSYSQTGYEVRVTCEVVPSKTLTAKEVHDEIAGEMKNAGYDAETDTITPEQLGANFDVSAAQKKLDVAEPGETVEIDADIQYPTVTAAELEKVLFRDVLGECKTHVSGTAARISNVKLSAASINGYVMNTGDVFSYNGVVGQRTAANGYQAAPAYVQGETVDEIGGGICQTSSTLYLACLRGNLEITERYAHRYVPAYIPWGMDATVSWGGPDYKFTNDTDYPIKIVTEYSNNYLTVKVLGTNIDGSYAKVTNEVLSQTDWETVYEVDETLAPGTPETVKTTPYTGYKVRTYHTIYDKDGKVIDSHFEADSNYKVRNKVIVRAPAPAVTQPEVPVIVPSEIPVETEQPAETPEIPENPEAPAEGTPIIVIPSPEELAAE